MNRCTFVMYHYIRETEGTRYPGIKAITPGEFRYQVDYFAERYEFVTVSDCVKAIYDGYKLPENAVHLTFDDGYTEHYKDVFPVLADRGIKASFFPSVKPVDRGELLDTNRIQFILASVDNVYILIDEIYRLLDEFRDEYKLESNEYYFKKLSKEVKRFHTKEQVFIKHLLQKELVPELRGLMLMRLFSKYVTSDEAAFASELYMNMHEIKELKNAGMYVGAHGYNHYHFTHLSNDEKLKEIALSIDFLKKIDSFTDGWVMCYPYGAYDDETLEILKARKCNLGLTINTGIANLTKENAFTLERFDTNDFPKKI